MMYFHKSNSIPRRAARINVRVLVVLLLVVVGSGGAVALIHKHQKRALIQRIRAEAAAAFQEKDWSEAARRLKLYLSAHPDDEAMLARYAQANLAIRPIEHQQVAAAIGAYRRLLRLHPADKEICAQLVRLYFAVRDFNEAAYICRRLLETDPDGAQARLWLGRILLAQRKTDEATRCLKALVEAHPDQTRAYLLLSTIEMQRPSLAAADKALAWLDRCLKANPQSTEATVYRARLHRLGRHDEASARADLEAADARRPDDRKVRLLLAQEWIAWGELDRAAAELKAVEQAPPPSVDPFDLEPGAIELLEFTTAGALALRRADRAEGVALADRALAALPPDQGLIFTPLAVDLYLAANRVDAARRAVERFNAAVEKRHDSDPSLKEQAALLSAIVAAAEDKPHRVIDLLRGLVARNPDSTDAWRSLWRAYDRTGQTRLARNALEHYVKQAPDDADAVLALAESYRDLDWAMTERYARQAERAAPQRADATLARIEAQINRLASDDTAAAREISSELDLLESAHPDRGDVPILQALLADRLGDRDRAIALLRRAAGVHKQQLTASMRLVDLLRRSSRLDEAAAVCRAIVDKHPELAAPRIVLADLQRTAGDKEQARKTLAAAAEQLRGEEASTASYALARFLLASGERSAAIDLLDELAARAPDDAAPRVTLLELPEVGQDIKRARALVAELKRIEGEHGLRWRLEQARLLLRGEDGEQNRDTAIALLEECLAADPGWSLPALQLGNLRERLGQEAKAEAVYRRLLRANPSDAAVADRLLTLLEKQRRFADARTVLDQVRGDSIVLRRHRINAAVHRKDFDAAIAELYRTIADHPKNAEARVLLARLVFRARNDADRALAILEEAQPLVSDRLAAAGLRAQIMRSQGRGDEALRELDENVRDHDGFEAYLLRARHFTATGEFKKAERDFKHLTRPGERAAEGFHLLGLFYLQHGREDEAVAALEAGIAAATEKTPLKTALVRALVGSLNSERRARGAAMLSELLAADPDNPGLLLLRVTLLLARHDVEATEEADRLLAEIIERHPRETQAYLAAAGLARDHGDLEQADRLLTRALGANPADVRILLAKAELERGRRHPEAASELIATVLDADPMNVDALNLQAQLEIDAGDLDAARGHNDSALKTAPTDAQAQVVHAWILHKSGKREQAIRGLETYLAEHNGRGALPVRVALGDLHIEANDLPAAGRQLEQAEALGPNDPKVLRLRLRYLFKRKDFAALSARLSRLVADRSNEPSLLIFGADLLASTGRPEDFEQARGLVRHVLEANPGSAEALAKLAWFAYRSGDVEGAERAYRKVVAIRPRDAQALNALAWILSEEKRDAAAALAFAEQGLAFHPSNFHLLDTRGVILLRLDRLDEAQADFQRCIDLTDRFPGTRAQAWLHLARVRLAQGDREKAKDCLDAAREIDDREHVLPDSARRDLRLLHESVARSSARDM
ncbi:MAG: tetratricopeptide repeat protein [Phycisphaerae bacterium]